MKQDMTMKALIAILLALLHVPALGAIHVIGDSHSLIFQHIEKSEVHWIGPITMHRIGRDGINLREYNVEDNSIVIFAFGEIDARCHIGKQSDLQGIAVEEVIDRLVTNYIKAILNAKNHYTQLHCIVYGAIPPSDGAAHPDFPRYGTLEERAAVTKKLNQRLALLCEDYQIPFLNVYEDYADERGGLRPELSDSNVHIGPSCKEPLQQKLKELLTLWEFY